MPLKSTPPDKPINGDAAKYLAYREAWTRVSLACEHGFPFEAIAILESIITDRLLAYLNAIGWPPGGRFEPLANLVKRWRKAHPQPASNGHFADLASALDDWRDKRNRAVHGIVHSPADAAIGRLLEQIRSVRADLRFREDGVQTVLTLDRQEAGK
ncbi:MAG TPA: hypothetical protein DDY78_14405 [Planctomycetales bacterium]|jgi:hypothetical protein|nr:hypothetical protein [Planctomycetales bacterium]